jgi:hypothetical protein
MVLDYITLNKEGIAADITLNILPIDMFLKELQLCGTSQNQIYFHQLQQISKKQNILGYKHMKRPLSILFFMYKNFKSLLICKQKIYT